VPFGQNCKHFVILANTNEANIFCGCFTFIVGLRNEAVALCHAAMAVHSIAKISVAKNVIFICISS
jgi:hypothetical protein